MSEPAPVELTFWRTFYRYLLSIVGSLVAGAFWFGLTQGLTLPGGGVTLIPRVFHLGLIAIIVTGVLALAVGILLMGYLWLAIDLSRPAPEGVDEAERNTQLFVLWMGIPVGVVLVCGAVALASVLVTRLLFG